MTIEEHSSKSFSAIFADGYFEKITITEVLNKGGAAGKIFLVKEHPTLVAKIFHSLSKSASNREKLRAMMLNRPSLSPALKNGREDENHHSYIQAAWPEAMLEDENGFCVGYLMPIIDLSRASSLDHFMQKSVRQKLGLSEKYEHRLQIAYNLCAMVTALHERGHYVVDLKPSNVFVYKDSMMISMLDCDGFSILGEHGRYPAEFVSEEYIYPEGMELSCEEMGEEQDKFALAVIVFKLLNGGVHPFSGMPRKSGQIALSIQERIAQNHYAYGSWADMYQSPHPYSIHEFFHKDTLELFDRAFMKGQKLPRPSAIEWGDHIRELLKNLKECKKDPSHSYFTSKGCGLCMIEEKFKNNLGEIQKQLQTPKTIRGVDIEKISPERAEQEKSKKRKKIIHLNRLGTFFIFAYIIFWAVLHKIAAPFFENLKAIGLGGISLLLISIMFGLNLVFKKLSQKLPILRNPLVPQMLQVYALIFILISLFILKLIPLELFMLAK